MRRLVLLIAAGAVLTLAPMLVFGKNAWPGSLAALCLYSVAAPLVAALGAAWWVETVVTAIAWLALIVALGQLPATSALGEGAMVFALPVMIYPPAVLISAIVRLVRYRRAARPASPSV